jgi:RNA polymerase sigma-70 factor, ECF subfamily
MPDIELHKRFVAGEQAAGGELCRRYFDAVCGYFERRLPEQAEDLAQEVFIVYARDPGRMTGERVRAFFYGIARNVLLHELRRQSRHPADALDDLSLRDAATGISTIVAEHEATRLFLEALQSLSTIHQDLCELFLFEGMSIEEAAAALGIPENTCRSRRGRAIRELRERVAALELDPRRVAIALSKLGQLRRARGEGPGGGLAALVELFEGTSVEELRGIVAATDDSHDPRLGPERRG